MKNNILEKELKVKDNLVRILNINNTDYISLTDLARYKNETNPGDVIIKWMSNKDSFDFYSLWEELFNPNFKLAESREFKMNSGSHSFTMSPSRWIQTTNAIGFVSKRGKYDGGTFAHPDIALEFASWIDTGFKLYLIKEFERLKSEEARNQKIEWNVRRNLSKTNYRIHTDSIKENRIPYLNDKQKQYIYADEADVLNVALFGVTAKEWRVKNPNAKGNIRDSANIVHLIVLSNLEVLNAEMMEQKIELPKRLERLNEIAIKQLLILYEDNNITKIEESEKLKLGSELT